MFNTIEVEPMIYLTHFEPFPSVTPKKTPVSRLIRKMEIAQKGIDRDIRLSVMGDFILETTGEKYNVDEFSMAIIVNNKLCLIVNDHNIGDSRAIKVKPTITSVYKLYI